MTRAEEILLKEMRYIASISNGQVKRVAECALASVSEYLATEPKQCDHSEEHLDMVGERAELIEKLRAKHDERFVVSPSIYSKAADMLEADAQQATPDIKALQAKGKGPAPCVRFCEANAFQIEIRRLTAEINAQQAKSKDAELIAVYAKLAEAELRAGRIEAQHKSQCRITESALNELTQQAKRVPMTPQEIRDWWASENKLEDCDMCKLHDFETVVRAVEERQGITPADKGTHILRTPTDWSAA